MYQRTIGPKHPIQRVCQIVIITKENHEQWWHSWGQTDARNWFSLVGSIVGANWKVGVFQ
jgi:hypothetical protein